MNGNTLSEALGTLPEDMVAEAMEPARAVQRFSWLRLAACFAVIIGLLFCWPKTEQGIVTAPGILAVTVYALNDSGVSAVVSEPASGLIDFPWEDWKWSPGVNAAPGLPIMLSVAGKDDVYFLVTVCGGSVMQENTGYGGHGTAYVQNTQIFQAENHSKLYWNCWELGYSEAFMGDTAYLDVIIYENGMITGYAVIGINRENVDLTEKSWSFSLEMLSSVYFPMIHGKHQKIDENTVRALMGEVK